MWSGEQAILLENFSILTSLFFCLRIIILSVNRVSLALLLSFIPAIAFAESSDGKGLAVGLGIAAFIAWSIAISLCRAGGGWILLGVLIGIFIALPLTGYAFVGNFVAFGL